MQVKPAEMRVVRMMDPKKTDDSAPGPPRTDSARTAATSSGNAVVFTAAGSYNLGRCRPPSRCLSAWGTSGCMSVHMLAVLEMMLNIIGTTTSKPNPNSCGDRQRSLQLGGNSGIEE